jgi:hypothetical protein
MCVDCVLASPGIAQVDPGDGPFPEVVLSHPPSTLRNVDGGPLGGAEAVDPRAATINAKKHRRRAPGPPRGSDLHP